MSANIVENLTVVVQDTPVTGNYNANFPLHALVTTLLAKTKQGVQDAAQWVLRTEDGKITFDLAKTIGEAGIGSNQTLRLVLKRDGVVA